MSRAKLIYNATVVPTMMYGNELMVLNKQRTRVSGSGNRDESIEKNSVKEKVRQGEKLEDQRGVRERWSEEEGSKKPAELERCFGMR